jgi:hypothetical protein
MTMDRYDDKDTTRARPTDDDTEKRAGDVLGLGGAAVPKSPADPTTEYDEESIARRRERASGMDESGPRTAPADRSSGATGIDMGAGGSGTDIE